MKPISKDKKVIRKVTTILDEMFEIREYSPSGSREQTQDPSIPIIPSEQKQYIIGSALPTIPVTSLIAERYIPPEENEERENYRILYSRQERKQETETIERLLMDENDFNSCQTIKTSLKDDEEMIYYVLPREDYEEVSQGLKEINEAYRIPKTQYYPEGIYSILTIKHLLERQGYVEIELIEDEKRLEELKEHVIRTSNQPKLDIEEFLKEELN